MPRECWLGTPSIHTYIPPHHRTSNWLTGVFYLPSLCSGGGEGPELEVRWTLTRGQLRSHRGLRASAPQGRGRGRRMVPVTTKVLSEMTARWVLVPKP